MLGGTDEVQVLALDLVHHGVHLGEGHDTLHHVAVDHEGRDDIGEALVDHEVTGIGQDSLVQAGNVAQQVVEAVAGDPSLYYVHRFHLHFLDIPLQHMALIPK